MTDNIFDVLEKALNASAKSAPFGLPFAQFLSTIESTDLDPQKTLFISARVADQELADRELPHQLNCCFKFGRTLFLCDPCFAVRLGKLIGYGTLPQRFSSIEVPGVTKLDITLDALRKVKGQVDRVAAVITLGTFGSDKLTFCFIGKLANFAPDEDGLFSEVTSEFTLDASIKEPEELKEELTQIDLAQELKDRGIIITKESLEGQVIYMYEKLTDHEYGDQCSLLTNFFVHAVVSEFSGLPELDIDTRKWPAQKQIELSEALADQEMVTKVKDLTYAISWSYIGPYIDLLAAESAAANEQEIEPWYI